MITQAVYSIVIGLVLSSLLSLPWIVWQYRRYGAPSLGRMCWYVVAVVYAAAVVAYTLFPIPHLSEQFCAARGRPIVLDPTQYFRDMAHEYAGASPAVILRSWATRQMVLNVALFVPFGVLGRRLFGWSKGATILAGLGASLLVEATQYTGNWFLMPCSYRLADVNDLLTNTLGAAVGVGVAALLPRWTARPEYLREQRDRARPVSTLRRWTSILLDGWYAFLVSAVVWVGTLGGFVLLNGIDSSRYLSNEQWALLRAAAEALMVLAVLALVAVPAATRNGATLGQRTVYLEPVPADGQRWRQVAAELIVWVPFLLPFVRPSLSANLVCWGAIVAHLWLSRRGGPGLGGRLVGVEMRDSRAA